MFHLTGGQEVEINSTEIVAIRAPRSPDAVHKDVSCVIFTTDGKFIAVQETCEQVERKVKDAADEPQ